MIARRVGSSCCTSSSHERQPGASMMRAMTERRKSRSAAVGYQMAGLKVIELLHPEPRRSTTDRVGFEPTVPLRVHRFSRPAVSTAHAPVQLLDVETGRRTDG